MPAEEPVWFDTEAMLAHRTSLTARGIAMSLIFEVWAQDRQPFAWDPDELASKISAPDVSPAMLKRHEREIASFFVAQPDGRWAPNPMFIRSGEPDDEATH